MSETERPKSARRILAEWKDTIRQGEIVIFNRASAVANVLGAVGWEAVGHPKLALLSVTSAIYFELRHKRQVNEKRRIEESAQ